MTRRRPRGERPVCRQDWNVGFMTTQSIEIPCLFARSCQSLPDIARVRRKRGPAT
jgi:hypothetical protein